MENKVDDLGYISFKKIINIYTGIYIIEKYSKSYISIYLNIKYIQKYLNEMNCPVVLIDNINPNIFYEWLSNPICDHMNINKILLYNIILIITDKIKLDFNNSDILQMILDHNEYNIYSCLSVVYDNPIYTKTNFNYLMDLPLNEKNKYSHIYFMIHNYIFDIETSYIRISLVKNIDYDMVSYIKRGTDIYNKNLEQMEKDIFHLTHNYPNLNFEDRSNPNEVPDELILCGYFQFNNNNINTFISIIYKNIIIKYCPIKLYNY